MTKIAVFASGNGSNFEAVVKYFKGSGIEFVCISDNSKAFVLERARKLEVKSFYVPFENTYEFLIENKFDLIVLAGYMRILPQKVLDLGCFINIHPSLLPKFKGKYAIKRAYNAHVPITGVSVHYVSKEVDSGKIIEQKSIKVPDDMTLNELEEEIHKIEHELLPRVIEKLIKKYNILLIGAGAREHALADKIIQSKKLNKLYLYKANDGFKNLGENIQVNDYIELAQAAKAKKTDFVIIGSEQPLAEGIVDIFNSYGIECIGSNKYWTQLESSKSFAKNFMKRNNINTADYVVVEKFEDICKIPFNFPYVVKADGLALGKGVCIVYNQQQAEKVIKEYLNGKFKEASKKIVVEEFLKGQEISFICLWDGKTLLPMQPVCDYKKLYNSDLAPNTGGMGAVCPIQVDERLLKNYTDLLQNALRHESAIFKGVIYSGLIMTDNGIKVLEFNMRFGDPETQVIMMNMESDLVELFINTLETQLDKTEVIYKEGRAYCVVLASLGYPDIPMKGKEIAFKNINEDVKIFYAGVKKENGKLYTNSGRVMCICARGNGALKKIYTAIDNIYYEGKIFRTDIGKQLLIGFSDIEVRKI